MLTKVTGPQQGTALVTGLPLTTVHKTLEHVENTEHVVFATVLVLAVVLGLGWSSSRSGRCAGSRRRRPR